MCRSVLHRRPEAESKLDQLEQAVNNGMIPNSPEEVERLEVEN